jgi:hypothetical protein
VTAFRLLTAACLILPSLPLHAADDPAESCDVIRARIGVAPLADPELLRSLAARQDCAFTSAEVYRAAYGDRPLPPPEPRDSRHYRQHDDDD